LGFSHFDSLVLSLCILEEAKAVRSTEE